MHKGHIEASTCRSCGAAPGCSCIAPHTRVTYVRTRLAGRPGYTEFCYERVCDYFESFRNPGPLPDPHDRRDEWKLAQLDALEALGPLETLGQRIREARQKAGLTMGDVARALSITVVEVSNYERDLDVPSDEMQDHMFGMFKQRSG